MEKREFEARFLERLNPQQKEAVQSVDGAVLLLAVPGSGKTTVLVTRLGYMVLCRGIRPENILTMTYTDAATREMRQRFSRMFGEDLGNAMEFRTINGVSAKIILYYSQHVSGKKPFDVAENPQTAAMIREVYQNLFHDFPTESTIREIRTAMTYCKNRMLSLEEIAKLDLGISKLPELYRGYCQALKAQRLMDYDDQMAYALTILKSYPAILDRFQEEYRFLCVDEAQDTSKIQHEIIGLLAQKYGNLFMVGDEDQSIYGFRAAYPEALLEFETTYPGAKVLLMEQNYRSTLEIVRAANGFVSKNRFRHKKTMEATRKSGLPIQFLQALDRSAQYKFLFGLAQRCTEETAVLYRNNDSALPLIDLLERHQIPYNCRRFEECFFTHKILVDVKSLIRLAYDPRDTAAFWEIYYKIGCGISKEAAEQACTDCQASEKTIWEALLSQDLRPYTQDMVKSTAFLLEQLKTDSAERAIQRIRKGLHYEDFVRERKLDSGKLDILGMLARNEASAEALLRRLDELQIILQHHENRRENHFLLSTVHSSKGLEFERVYLLDVFDGVLPARTRNELRDAEDHRLYEEDRRLFYVAMTRAKEELYLFECRDHDSAFVAEIRENIPAERIDPTDFFQVFQRELLGKSYHSKDFGRGTVLAQGRDAYLVEYEHSEFRLLTLSQMAQTRTLTLPLEEPKKVEIPLELNLEIGAVTHHKAFGRGIIKSLDDNMIGIQFEGDDTPKRFILSTCLEQKLLS